MTTPLLGIREMQESDIPSIASYWLDSDPQYLINMGVDLDKLPPRAAFTQMLQTQIKAPLNQKKTYCMIWTIEEQAVGHCNVNNIAFGQNAHMHLHLWQGQNRHKGLGKAFVEMSLPFFFTNLELQQLICEPFAANPAPNKTLEKVGFELVKTYTTVPGSITREQKVNRWELTLADFQKRF